MRVLTGDLLRDAGVTTLASGIAKQSPLRGLWDSYVMRGFTGDPNFGSDYMLNGFSSSRGYNGLREPGGMVNITTKKPKFAPEYGADVSLGSFQTRRAAVDLTGPLSDTVAYRVNAAHEEGHSFRDTVKVERSLFSPSFFWLAGEHTTVSYEIEAVQQRAPFDRGVQAVNGKLGAVPVSRFLGEPDDGPMTVKSLGQQLFIHHALSDDWTVQAGASYRDSELTGYSTEANKLLADGRTLSRQRRYRDYSATDVSARVELLGKFRTWALAHEALAGVDACHFDDHRVQLRRNPSTRRKGNRRAACMCKINWSWARNGRRWSACAYAYTNATVTRGDNTIGTGSRFANVPRHSANLLATQQFALGTGMASVGGGVQYVAERLGDVVISSKFALPAYTTAKLLASYSPNAKLRLALSVETCSTAATMRVPAAPFEWRRGPSARLP